MRVSHRVWKTLKRWAGAREVLCLFLRRERLVPILAQVGNTALGAFRFARHTNVAAMQNEPMMGILYIGRGYDFLEFALDIKHRLARRDAGPVRHPEDVCVDCDGRMAECRVQYNIGRLAPDARQGFQRFTIIRHFTVVLLQQDLASLDHIPGFGLVQAYRLDVIGHAVFTKGQQAGRGTVLREKLAGRQVDGAIGGLGRQQNRDQQLEGGLVFELSRGRWVGGLKAGEDFAAFGAVHECWRRARARASASAMTCLRVAASSSAARDTGALLASVRAARPDDSSCKAASRACLC